MLLFVFPGRWLGTGHDAGDIRILLAGSRPVGTALLLFLTARRLLLLFFKASTLSRPLVLSRSRFLQTVPPARRLVYLQRVQIVPVSFDSPLPRFTGIDCAGRPSGIDPAGRTSISTLLRSMTAGAGFESIRTGR